MTGAPTSDVRLRLSSGAVGVLAMTGGALIVSVASQTALARTFGAVGLGTYQVTSLFVIVVATVLTLGLPLAVAQRVASVDESGVKDREHVVASAAAITLPLGVLAASAGLLLWPAIASRVAPNADVPSAAVALAVLASVVHSLVVSLLMARLHMRLATLVVLVQPAAVLTGIVAVGSLDASWLAALGFIVAGLLAATFLVARGSLARPHRSEIVLLARRSLGATAVLHATLLSQWFERAVVAVLAGAVALGAFAAASLAVEAVQRLPRSLGGFGVAAYARLEHDPAAVSRVLGSNVRLLAAAYVVVGTALVAAGPQLLTFVFGPEFVLARTTVRLLAIALVPSGIALSLASAAAGTHAPGTGRIALTIAVLHLTVVIATTSVFSIAGTALAQIVTWSLATILYRSALAPADRREIDHSLARTAGVAVPSWALAWVIGTSDVPALFGTAPVVAASAALVASFLLRAPDRRMLALVIKRRGQDMSASMNRGVHTRSE